MIEKIKDSLKILSSQHINFTRNNDHGIQFYNDLKETWFSDFRNYISYWPFKRDWILWTSRILRHMFLAP